ncbi:MAG: nicotinamide mononucleotide transporter [Proteobacteria bacterium]|nr:nicotinamide mononucleotide transporter [Pseudomonadota bacterium]
MLHELYEQLVAINFFELAGLLSGLLCVWLLIRQSIWTWPIGLVYSLVSLVVFMQTKLYSEFGLHIYYAVMNAYGWYYWSRADAQDSSGSLPVTRINRVTGYILLALVALGIPLLAELMLQFTDTDMAYADSTITIMSFSAMWMTARKLIENWYVWLLVDIIATIVYIIKGIELYAVLYCVYIGMAVAGLIAWRATLVARERLQETAGI